jgi:signal transduction histidine kinase/DNA-binding response OmpR family regulator
VPEDVSTLIAGESQAAEGRAARVLVVADNRELQRAVTDYLRTDGFEVSSAFDSIAAYRQAIAERPDLLLIDVSARMRGRELVRLLRQKRELKGIPIVIVVPRTDEDTRDRLLGEGVEDCLEEPIPAAVLRARVRNLCERKRADDRAISLRRRFEAVALASMRIAEAVAGIPEACLRTVLQTVALNAQTLTGAELAAAGIGGDDHHPFETWAGTGMSVERLASIGTLYEPVNLLGSFSREAKAVRLRDLGEHGNAGVRAAAGFEVRSFLGVPLRFRGRVIGSLYLANKQGDVEFTADDQGTVEMLARSAGVAIETARRYEAEGRSHAWLRAVLDQMPQAIMVMNAEGHVTFENRSMRELVKVTPPVVDPFGNTAVVDLRRLAGEALGPGDLPIVKALVERKSTRPHELVGRRADDHRVPLLVSAVPILAPSGELAGAAMTCQDISRIKEIEHRRQEWASLVAHDLRQPISVIALRASLLLRSNLSIGQHEDIRQINAAAQRLSRMVNDLLDASLLESRRLPVALDRLEMAPLLHAIVEREPLIAKRTTLHLPDGPLFVKGDAQRLEQVVTNLLTNALKYGAPDANIELVLRRVNAHAEISVTNRGPGIPSEQLSQLFRRFIRARHIGTGSVKGLGLGLYIAKGLVQAHGGRIWADSVPGASTTFHITIPLEESCSNVDSHRSPDTAAATAPLPVEQP